MNVIKKYEELQEKSEEFGSFKISIKNEIKDSFTKFLNNIVGMEDLSSLEFDLNDDILYPDQIKQLMNTCSSLGVQLDYLCSDNNRFNLHFIEEDKE